MDDKFFDIRPFSDDEIPTKLNDIVNNPWLIEFLRTYKFGNTPKFLNPLIESIIHFVIKQTFKKVKSVDQFQQEISIKHFLKKIIENTTDSITVSGLENLDPKKSYLFISNHRDIVLDAALINFMLVKNNFVTPEIAFGDNLLYNNFISDIIRINRAFIVKRGLKPRELLLSSQILSEYIYLVLNSGRSIWIAQREGRAKDGNDKTNPALLKMLYYYDRDKKVNFNDFVNNYRIVPTAISYEYDPCDRLKAWEIYRRSRTTNFIKKKKEDLISMIIGITKKKGKIHIHYDLPITGTFNDIENVSEAIDRSIHKNYKLWSSNYIAYDIINQTNKYSDKYTKNDEKKFLNRFDKLPVEVKEVALKTYAMPVINNELN